jgi:hypothetical protein
MVSIDSCPKLLKPKKLDPSEAPDLCSGPLKAAGDYVLNVCLGVHLIPGILLND